MSNNLDLLFFIGRPLSPVYGLAMKVREKFYERGIFRSHPLPVPVVSIGNLVLGGTGKTPTVRYLAEFLQAQGYSPAIISRGYGGQSAEEINLVSDAHSVLLSPEQAGDEPYMLACSLPGVPVLTGRRRIHPSRWAVVELGADILILDDGFQHLAIQRDIDLVLFDATDLAGNSRIFPGGVLREPIAALNRCNAFLITGVTERNRGNAECFAELLRNRFKNKPVFYSSVGTTRLNGPVNNRVDDSNANTFFGFCGIANPARFKETLQSLGIQLAGFAVLPDHARYSQSLMDNICVKAAKAGASQLVTTEKDYVKIKGLSIAMPLGVLEIRSRQERAFEDFILESLNKVETKGGFRSRRG
jgi:tetraacyldisaccharide 4'-kinase